MSTERTDTERIDWLEAHQEFSLNKRKKFWTCSKATSYEFNNYPTMRQAIDAAMDETWNKE